MSDDSADAPLESVLQDPARLAGVRSSGLLDSAPEPDFDRWTRFVRTVMDADVSLITLLDRDRQFFKSASGLDEPWASRRETPLSHSFCKHVVASGETLRVADARADPVLEGNAAITDLGVVAYLGVPLRSREGRVLGSISAIQHARREWSDRDVRILEDVATAVQSRIELTALEDRSSVVLAHLSVLLSHAPVGLWTVDRGLRFTWTGGRALDEMGIDRDQLIGTTVTELFGTDDPERPEVAAYAEAIAGRASEFEVEWGERTWAVRLSPLYDGDEVTGAIGVAVDVTGHRDVERRLEERTAHFERLFEEAPEAIVLVDRQDRILQVNPEFERLFGYSAEEAEGRLVNDLITLPGGAAEATELTERVAQGERVELEAVRRRKDGSPVDVSILATPVRVGDQHQVYGIYRNITERKELEARLLHSQRLEAVGQLAGGVAHDFNNILTAILGHTQILLEQHRDDAALAEDLEEIGIAGERAARLTRQLLTFSRRDIASPRPTAVNEVIRRAQRLLERLIEERIRLSFDLQDPLPKVDIDPGQLEQIVMNLVINARDAMPTGGRVQVSTEQRAKTHADSTPGRPGFDGLILRVRDEGCGMSAEERARMFEPFYTTKTPGEGTGLGLSTVYGIVERARGYIEVDSTPGVGTVVSIHLPFVEGQEPVVADTEAADAVEKPDGERMPKSGGELVLLVDDERAVRRVTRRILEHAEYRVIEAASGEEALAICDKADEPPTAVVSDVVMPGMSGYELVEELHDRDPGIAILLMTGYSEPGAGNEALHGRILKKPFDAATLVRMLRERLERG